jgi:kojibiose phosphorylase
MRTRTSGRIVAFDVSSRLHARSAPDAPQTLVQPDWVAERWTWLAQPGRSARLAKLATVYTSREVAQPLAAASAHLERLQRRGPTPLVRDHQRAWQERLEDADVRIVGDDAAQRALRFAEYHLIATANPEDERTSIGARLLSGHAYQGHVFWDTELFMLPFFIYTHPPSARAMLMYRYHTLPAAREKARSLGYRGALYAWESAESGAETTPLTVLSPTGEVVPIWTGLQEHHISADVAYAVWHYWQATGDDAFLLVAGAEILLETARFWASRATREADGRYHIRRVIGPDEYHEGVDDNAYTNWLARWNLEQGRKIADWLRARWPGRWAALAERLGLTDAELEEWAAVARGLVDNLDPATGLIAQHAGFLQLERVDLADYEPRSVPIDVILGRERTQQTQVIKQADVVMLLHLFWSQLDPRVREVNFRYYEPICGHGSSLSPAIHALVAARLGDLPLAERYFHQAATIDLGDTFGNTAGGVHAAALGGLWQAVVFGCAGLELRDDGLGFTPNPLPRWRSLTVPLQWRGRRLRVTITQPPVAIEVALLAGGEPLQVTVAGGSPTLLAAERPVRARRAPEGWEYL